MTTHQRANYGDTEVLARALHKTPDDPVVTDLLEAATARFISHIGYRLDYQTDQDIWLSGDGGPMLALPGAPVHGEPEIHVYDHRGNQAWEAHGVQVGRRTGILWRAAGWPDGIENIHVTYDHGYQTIPADVTAAVNESALLATTARPGISRVSTGDESIDFDKTIAAGGTTANWAAVVEKYRLSNNGDGM